MKSTIIKSALVAVVGLALCAPVALQAAATTTATTAATTTVKKAKTKTDKIQYEGTVKSIDTAANSITVTTKKGEMTFVTNPATKVKVDKKAGAIADITMGEKVTGSYTKDDAGTLTACSVHGWTKK